MKKLALILAMMASPAWAQNYDDYGYASRNAAVETAREYEQQLQSERQEQQIYQQQQQIQQMQSQQPYTQYVPVYGDGTQSTQ